MALIERVTAVQVEHAFGMLLVAAVGEVRGSGWIRGRLVPRYYASPPSHGLWEMDFDADPPLGPQFPGTFPMAAAMALEPAPWVKGVRVLSEAGPVDSLISGAKSGLQAPFNAPVSSAIIKQQIAHWEDLPIPTGNTKWDPWPHAEMKKLVHELILTVDGPDSAKARACIEQAIAAGLIAAILAAIATGGTGLGAAISAFIASLESCLGSSFSVRVDDVSHWEYWWT